ncbi:hypothetical protein [Streptosporangium sp. NPDC048865]|uniref:hypothetical protein n=1 Tax=Streptosporangium sp. NPDC048865 TaxID=3155766 RepID=UPI00341C7310
MSTWKENLSQARVDAVERDRLPGWYATQGRRRLIASAVALSLALLWVDVPVSWAGAPSDGADLSDFALLALSMVIYFPAVTLLNIATRGVVNLAERHLDERQLAERLRTVAIAHRGTTGILVALFVTAIALGATQGRDYSMPGDAFFSLALALALTHFVIPLVVSGWRLPDPPGDDD